MHVFHDMLKAAITTFLLGISTIAAADSPYRGDYQGDRFDERYRDQTLYNDGRRERILLADNVKLGGRSNHAAWVPIDARAGIDRIRIKLETGRTFIDRVTVVYADGRRETQQVRRALTRRDPSITIDVRYGARGIMIDTTQRGYARRGGWSRYTNASVDVVGIRRW